MSLNASKLDYDKICKILKNEYDINIQDIIKIPNGSANLYHLVDFNNNEYVLKEFQDGFDVNKVIKDINVTELVKKNGIPTVEFIYNRNNYGYFLNNGNILTLQKYIGGTTKEFYTLDDIQCEEAAIYCYKIMDILNNSNIELPNFKMDIFELDKINRSIEKCNELVHGCHDEMMIKVLKDKKKMLIESSSIDFSHVNNITFLKSHGDYNTSQFIYDDNGKIKAIIDFASAKRLPIVWELLRSFIFMDHTYKNGQFSTSGLIKYLKAFNEKKILNKYDIEYMFKVYYMFLLNSMFGFEQYIKNNSQEYYLIGMNLYHQSKYLNEHMDEMEKVLKKRKMEVL